MPPKQQRIQVAPSTSRRQPPQGYLGNAYHTLTSEENRSVVLSVAMFGAAIAFFNSEWSEILLPGF